MKIRPFLTAAAAAALLPALPAQAQSQVTTLIVMDGSGSMWGQIDGRPKLEIARETVARVLAELPPEQPLGLMAYGHRERGVCSDIELLVPPGPDRTGDILTAVNAMRFQGKTPLTEAVRQAAETLRSTEEPATVVLITDGIETCDADPCALAQGLEASGVDFTAHVIGFGLRRDEDAELACIAANTGGLYLPASDAAGLGAALRQAVSAGSGGETPPPAPAAPTPEPEPVATPAPDTARYFPGDVLMAGVSLEPTGLTFGPEQPEPAEITFPPDGTASACQAACQADGACGAWRYEPAGSFTIGHPRCFLMRRGTEYNVRVYPVADGFVSGMKPGVIGLTTPYVPLGGTAEISLSVPGPVAPGDSFTVLWRGPASDGDWVDLVPEGYTELSGELSYFYVRDTFEIGDRPEGAGELTAPAEPGRYELRYVLGREVDRRVLATQPLIIGEDSPAVLVVDVTIRTVAGYETDLISWSAVPLDPHPEAPEAMAMPETFSGPWEASMTPGRWQVEGVSDSGLLFAATITVTGTPGEEFTIPVALETEGMGEDPVEVQPGRPHYDAGTGLSADLPEGWELTEAFYPETAGGVRADAPSATFTGPDGRMIVLNPMQWLESSGTCYDSSAGPLCVFGAEDDVTDAAVRTLLPSLTLAGPGPFGGPAFTPPGADPLSTLVPGWSAP